MRGFLKIAISGLVCIAGAVMMSSVHAVPSFAHKYDKKCSYCHNAWPQLNAKGRAFKERGYRLKEDLKGGGIVEMDGFPISGMFIARPFDKKDSGDQQIRAIHEVELFVAGAVGKRASFFTEIEAEDEHDFEPELGSTSLGWRFHDAFNVQMNYAGANWADGYGLLGDHFRLTRGHVGIIDAGLGGAEGSIRDSRQTVAMTGRFAREKLFYNLSYGGIAGDPEGEEDSAFSARVAFDITKNIMIGTMFLSGEATDATSGEGLAFSRAAFDTQLDLGGARIQAAYLMATDDQVGGASHENDAYTLQAYYAMKTEKGKPTFVPLLRLDHYTTDDANDQFDELTLNLTYYFAENVKGYVEYWSRYGAPTSDEEDSRFTIQLYVGL